MSATNAGSIVTIGDGPRHDCYGLGRWRSLTALVTFVVALGIFATPALAAKSPDSIWPTPSSGLPDGFSAVRGVAVNEATGHAYVVDRGSSRVIRFEENGDVERIWGAGVVAAGPNNVPQDEVQQVRIRASGGTYALSVRADGRLGFNEQQIVTVVADGGTFDLRLGGVLGPATEPISFDAPAATVQSALEAVAQIGIGNVTVTGADGGPWTIEFTGALAETNVPELFGVGTGLTGSPKSVTVTTPRETTASIAHDASSATVESALEALSYLEPADVSVGAPDLNFGPFDRVYPVTFAGGLADTDVAPMTAPSSLTGAVPTVAVHVLAEGAASAEICVPAAGDICKSGISQAGAGQFSLANDIAVEQSTGDVYVSDRARIQKFDALGAFERAWGRDVVRHGGAENVPVAETQKVTYLPPPRNPPTGGTFTLGFEGEETAPIAHNATAEAVEAALEALAALDPADVSVSGSAGDWTVVFSGAYASYDPPQITENDSGLTGTFTGTTSLTTVPLNASAEICTIPADCVGGRVAPNGLGDPARGGELGGEPIYVAVGAAGPVYTLETGATVTEANHRVQRFDSDGNFARTWGEDVIQAGKPGDLGADNGSADPGPVEICTVAADCKQGSKHGGVPGRFRAPAGIAADSTGRVYVVDRSASPQESAHRHVHRFAADGTSPVFFADAALETASLLSEQQLAGIAVDPSNDNLFVSTIDSPGGERVIREVDSAGNLVEDHAVGAGIPAPTALAYRDASGTLFASLSGDAFNNVVLFDDDGGIEGPTVTIEPATEVGATVATLHGTVNPNGIATTYTFEVSADGGENWSAVPSPPLEDPDGLTPESVQAIVTDLLPATEYEARLRAEAPLAGTSVSATTSFTTESLLPAVTTFPANQVSDTTAVVRGLVNPQSKPTTYRFEWGETTAYGNSVPVPEGELSGGTFSPVSFQLTGLQPSTEYHYRLVASNDQGTAFGDDRAFQTKSGSAGLAARVAEMVTPPFKVTRLTGRAGGGEGSNSNPGIPSLDGERILWNTDYFPLSEDQEFPFDGDRVLLSRTSEPAWEADSLISLTLVDDATAVNAFAGWQANSGDLLTQAWFFSNPILSNEGTGPLKHYTRRDGTGTAGFSGWIDNVDTQLHNDGEAVEADRDIALLNDDATAMSRFGLYRDLADDPETAADEDPSDEQQLPGRTGGRTLYLQRVADPDELPAAPKLLVSECTGAGADRTELPSRMGTGVVTDMIDTLPCGAGSVTSRRGAALGSSAGQPALGGPAATAMSDDGRRVFFVSPDPDAKDVPSSCATATGPETDCPPQLFVRQYDQNGQNQVVRWISRSRSVSDGKGGFGGAMIAGQRIAELGGGVSFQGASRDGSVVYFKTNAPLTPDDPNGGDSITEGSASNSSWDLYRYELPDEGDPGDGVLTRISGGPAGTADPSTSASTGGSSAPPGSGAPARFVSDDGSRAYFVTTAPIAGADESRPFGGVTKPGGAVGNDTVRNLYLFDGAASGADRWRFVAALPVSLSSGGGTVDKCATFAQLTGFSFELAGLGGKKDFQATPYNCVRGTPNGDVIAFATTGQLTGDDDDSAADVYLYDARSDELVRVSAPPQGVAPGAEVTGNGDLGHAPAAGFGGPIVHLDTTRGWGGGRTYNFAVNPNGDVSLFFESRLPLVDGDDNASGWDTYEWREGKLSLISLGNPDKHSYYSGNSSDGEDVFVFTDDRIDPRELDDHDFDVYDYRRGGGIPYDPPPPPCDVLAFECEVEATKAPPAPTAPSVGLRGGGNVEGTKRGCRKGAVRRGKRCVSRRALARRACRKVKDRRAKRRCIDRASKRIARAERRRARRSEKGSR